MSIAAKTIGRQIRAARIQRGLTQEKLAEQSGLHPTYIGQLERGEKNATIETIQKVCGALHIRTSTLFGTVEELGDAEHEQYALLCYRMLGELPRRSSGACMKLFA